MAEPVVLRAASRAVVPWRNGAGTTTVVAEGLSSAGTTEPLWRVSIATISRSAAFSEFVGVDRLLMPLSEAGLDLVVDGRRVHVRGSSVLAFAGESEVEAVDVVSPGLDLNLMTRRGGAEGRLSAVRVPAVLEVAEHEVAVAVVVAGEVRVGDDALGELDALLVDGAASLAVAGRGLLAVAWMSVAPDAVAP
jgi:environmental stress-induced protein Ves